MSTYQSVTTWQAEDFVVEVRYGFFSTIVEALEMGGVGIEKIFVDETGLWGELRDGARAPVGDCNFIVRRLREESRGEAGQRALTISDFEVIPMTTEAMRNEPAMRSFGWLSFGVINANGQPVLTFPWQR